MTIEVEAPDGSIIEFPDEMNQNEIHRAMLSQFGNKKPPEPKTFSPIETKAVPRPGEGGNYSSDITQRARNTAFGQGPGSVAGIPGVAAPLTPGAAAMAVRGVPSAIAAIPGTALAAGTGYFSSHFDDMPDWAKDFFHNLALHFQLGATGKK